MSYSYRPPQTKPTSQQLSNPAKSSNTKPIRQLSKQQLKIFQGVLSIIVLLMKTNRNKKIKQSFNKLKSVVKKQKKYSQLLARKLNYLFKQKQKQFTTTFFSCLVSNKISFYNTQMTTQKLIKNNAKNKSTAIIFYSLSKLFTKKLKNYFSELRTKSIQYSKSRIFKATHLFARLSKIYRRKLSESLGQIEKNKFRVLKIGKIVSRLQNFVSAKNKQNSFSFFTFMKLAFYKSQQKQIQNTNEDQNQKVTTVNPTNTNKQSLEKEKRDLQMRTRQLQVQLAQLQQQSHSNINSLKNDISRLQKQTESLKFNNELLQQNNTQLESQLQLIMLKNRRKLPRNQIWQNVYNNLIYFLSVNRNKTITKQQLIQAMELPLVPCGVNLQEINEENKVLQELLEEYKKSFPQPQRLQNLEGETALPYDFLKRKNKYYYMVLQVLAEWGGSGSKQLDQLNKDLQMLQKRLCEV